MKEAISSNAELLAVYACSPELTALADNTQSISQKEMKAISTLSSPSEILGVVSMTDLSFDGYELANESVLALDDIKDPGNLGTIIRTADWFGIRHILLSQETVDQFNPKVVQSTMGSLFRVKIYRTDLLESLRGLKSQGLSIYTAEMHGESPTEMSKKGGGALLVIGSESHGVSEGVSQLADKKITISRVGHAESLNAAVAAGILLNQWVGH